MACEMCPYDGDESQCSLCRADAEHRDRSRRYSQVVSAVCLIVLVVVFAVATVCGIVNVVSKH